MRAAAGSDVRRRQQRYRPPSGMVDAVDCEASGGREVSKPEPLKAAQTPKDAGPGQTQASELLSLLLAGGGVWTDEHGCETHPLNCRPAGSPRSMQEPHLRRGCGLWHGDSAFHEPELRSLGFGSAQAPVANARIRRYGSNLCGNRQNPPVSRVRAGWVLNAPALLATAGQEARTAEWKLEACTLIW